MVLTPDWGYWDTVDAAIAAINANCAVSCYPSRQRKKAPNCLGFLGRTSTCLSELPTGEHLVKCGPGGATTAVIRVYTTALGKKAAIRSS